MDTKSKSLPNLIKRWEQLLSAVADHSDDLEHFEACRAKLEAEVADLCATLDRRNALRVEVREATQELSNIAERVADLASRLRAGVLHRFGLHSEVLSEFGIRVVRPPKQGRKRPAVPSPAKGVLSQSHRTVK
jgi:hypothetical protein